MLRSHKNGLDQWPIHIVMLQRNKFDIRKEFYGSHEVARNPKKCLNKSKYVTAAIRIGLTTDVAQFPHRYVAKK